MFASERQQLIADLARREGRVEASILADKMAVTAETIRRDLKELEQRGVVRRVHGGAIPTERFGADRAVSERVTSQPEAKARIARVAYDQLPDDGSILLDAGTTTAALADLLVDGRTLTVLTNDLGIGQRLAGRPGLIVMVLGGRLRPVTHAMVDRWALRALEDVVVDVAYIATNGFSLEWGATTPDPAEAEVKAAMVAAGRRTVLLADSSKAGNDCFARFAALDAFDTLITDTALDDTTAAAIDDAGVPVVRA